MDLSRIEQQQSSACENVVRSSAIGTHRTAINKTDCRDAMKMLSKAVASIRSMKKLDSLEIGMPPYAGLSPCAKLPFPVIA
jgi:hypothetical protein